MDKNFLRTILSYFENLNSCKQCVVKTKKHKAERDADDDGNADSGLDEERGKSDDEIPE